MGIMERYSDAIDIERKPAKQKETAQRGAKTQKCPSTRKSRTHLRAGTSGWNSDKENYGEDGGTDKVAHP